METPKNTRQRPQRNPTPRLSERKKSLFSTSENGQRCEEEKIKNNFTLDGIEPLNSKSVCYSSSSNRSVEMLINNNDHPRVISFLHNNIENDSLNKITEPPSPPTRRSLRINAKPNISESLQSPCFKKSIDKDNSNMYGKENIPATPTSREFSDEQLHLLFTNSMKLNVLKNNSNCVSEDDADNNNEGIEVNEILPKEDVVISRSTNKRNLNPSSSSTTPSPKSKVFKLDNRLPHTSNSAAISTKCFYSSMKCSSTSKVSPVKVEFHSQISPKTRRHQRKNIGGINKGVSHKVRRKSKPSLRGRNNLKKTATSLTDILNTIRNEKLRNLIASKRQTKEQIDKVHNIFKTGQNPIEMAKPLTAIGGVTTNTNINNNIQNNNNNYIQNTYNNKEQDFDLTFSDSDFETAFETDEEEVIPMVTHSSERTRRLSADDLLPSISPGGDVIKPVVNRKFFKSGHSTATKKEVQITDNIKASVCNGKIIIVPEKKRARKRLKHRNTVNEFSMEQATVDDILKNFERSFEEPAQHVGTEMSNCSDNKHPNAGTEDLEEYYRLDGLNDHATVDEIQLQEDGDYSEFRRRIPFNTKDPEIIGQQHLLLDFLITNKICTEENFTIFIADPDNHKEEASRIVDQVIVVVKNSDFQQRIPYNTNDPHEIEQQKNFLEFLIENNICTEENFNIFIADYKNHRNEADVIITKTMAMRHNISVEELERNLNEYTAENATIETEAMEIEIENQNKPFNTTLEKNRSPSYLSPVVEDVKLFPIFYPGKCQPIVQQKSTRKTKIWTGGHGASQYQIDAGQKQYGARQCQKCGLVYSVHEPEEEKLHMEYHASLHVLRFKGWIDEDIVSIYPEWGADGRILRISDTSHAKRKERVMDVLQIVDKELGFSSYIFPKRFVAFFAIRKYQIVGLCLVQPLSQANKFMSVNGIDCCSEETFDAKCGISRIWVSPLHRRLRIATKLIQAVQINTIFGEEIPLQMIAFSAPTVDGKNFAREVTKLDNFLVYQ